MIMKNNLIPAILALSLACAAAAFSQPFGTGLIAEDDISSKIPKRAALRTKSLTENVPKSCSLKRYAPAVLRQKGGTCVGWATAYAARTISEAAANGWTDQAVIDRESYSPYFTYRLSRWNADCEAGSQISNALKEMKRVGAIKRNDAPDACLSNVSDGMRSKAAEHRIKEYFTTFDGYDKPKDKIDRAKKAISEGKPVVIAMDVDYNFMRKFKVWNGFLSAAGAGGHAMCVVGYDDDMYGGAFEIMNSWGKKWGDKGFAWIRYDDFGKNVRSGNDIYIPPKQPPTLIAGSLQFKIYGGEEMKTALQNKGGLPVYKMTREGGHSSGTKFQIFLSNDNPAYVYVISSDDSNDVEKIFPPDANTSAALFDKKNDIALPDENGDRLYELDKTAGTTYALVLYSLTELPVDEIIEKIRAGNGDFTKKTRNAVGEDLVPIDEINLDRQNIKFWARSRKPTVAIVVEIPHKRLD